jgi:hypothetical protein
MRLLSRRPVVGFAVLLYGVAGAFAQPPPSLGTAASFAVLGGSAINAGASTITGNLGVSPGNTITGSPTVKLGAIFRDDAMARQAQKDSAAAYKDLASRTCISPPSTTLPSGVYCLSSLSGTLTLDAGGDRDAFWIFQTTTTLTTAPDSSVRVINGGYEGNVFWQAGDSAILGERTVFVGSILARNDITLKSGASLSGRALAQTGTVTLNGNNVSLCCTPITLAPATLADGKVGNPYVPVTFSAIGGTAPYTFVVSEPLPPGLTATLSGTPTKAGSYIVTVTATDSLGCVGHQDYPILIVCGTIVLDPPELSKSCAPLPQTITASGGTGPYTFQVVDRTLPEGVALSAGGELTGTPATGCFIVTVEATDALGCAGRRIYEICTIAFLTPTLPGGTIATQYPATTLKATGGHGGYVFSFTPGTLPPGLTLSSEGNFSGIPKTAGCFTFTVTATDKLGFFCTKTYTVCVTCPVTFNVPPLNGTVGTLFSETIAATGGTKDFTFVASRSLPPGLNLFSDGLLQGVPTTPGSYTFTVTATNPECCSGTQTYTMVIVCSTLEITPSTLPPAIFGVPYSQQLTASGGIGPYAFRITSGNLPLWL